MQTTSLGTTLIGRTGSRHHPRRSRCVGDRGRRLREGLGPQVDDDSIAAIHRALELGVDWVGTAAAHGFGHSEQVVGHARAGAPDHQRPYVFTKASLIEGPGRTIEHNRKRDSILRDAEASLKQPLGLDTSDIAAIEGTNL